MGFAVLYPSLLFRSCERVLDGEASLEHLAILQIFGIEYVAARQQGCRNNQGIPMADLVRSPMQMALSTVCGPTLRGL